MLLSNWDNKDARDWTSNAGILERRGGRGRQRIYHVTDWGGSMGRWGHLFFREKWDCQQFADQSDQFIKMDDDGEVSFRYSSWNNDDDFKHDITVADVTWVAKPLSRISDSQLRTALRRSGATTHEAQHFTQALRARMKQLESVASSRPAGLQTLSSRE